jgi:hypothetical protein
MGMEILTSVGWMAVFAGLAVFGRWLVKHSPAPNDSDATPDVPAACVVTARREARFPAAASRPVAWERITGHILVVIGVGACVLIAIATFFWALCGQC